MCRRGLATWDSGTEGNYWGDGIGNDPHPIQGGESEDRYPLMQSWTDTPPQNGYLNGDNQIAPADARVAFQLAATGAHTPAADVYSAPA